MNPRLALAFCLGLSTLSCHDSSSGGGNAVNQAPSITTDLGTDPVVNVGGLLEFDVQVTDPEGDAVSLTLLDPPPGCVLSPARTVSAPVTRALRWDVLKRSVGLVHLLF